MPLPFDATLKAIVADHPDDFAPLFGLPTGEPVVPVNVDLSTISAATDVALAYGQPVREVVDLNFQSSADASLPGRLLLYNAALNGRNGVPVRSVLVLLRKGADGSNLTGVHAYGDARGRVEFHYEVIRLWQRPVADLLRLNLSALPLATLGELPVDRPKTDALRAVAQEIVRRLNAETDPADAARLLTAAFTLTGMRADVSELETIYRGMGVMSATTAWDAALEEGERRGEIRGERRGEIQGQLRVLLRLGQKQLGPPDAATEAELKAVRDLDRLERLADAILTAKSWAELLATPGPR